MSLNWLLKKSSQFTWKQWKTYLSRTSASANWTPSSVCFYLALREGTSCKGAFFPCLIVSPWQSDTDDVEPWSVSDWWTLGYEFRAQKNNQSEIYRKIMGSNHRSVWQNQEKFLFKNDLARNTLTSLHSFWSFMMFVLLYISSIWLLFSWGTKI